MQSLVDWRLSSVNKQFPQCDLLVMLYLDLLLVHRSQFLHLYWQIIQILQSTCRKEGLNLPSELARRIAEQSGRNVRRALLMCEACRVQQYPFNADQQVTEPDWEVFLRETARMIVQQQTPKR
jgi:DNA polymerase III delta prime subunit